MGKIYYVMGKSASGKDTIYKRLVKELPELGTVRMYTTRPIRDGETNGVEYIFTDEKQLQAMKDAGKVIECRTYDTIYGPWSYFTADDGQINLSEGYCSLDPSVDRFSADCLNDKKYQPGTIKCRKRKQIHYTQIGREKNCHI